ncbi:MAG: hypothetical protein DRP51_02895 [Candidatus Zixiibacteriota bacterium]|nr:MAG: hypothetical protein DRP51_02895 [candidate division Zixibacteria bacterium]
MDTIDFFSINLYTYNIIQLAEVSEMDRKKPIQYALYLVIIFGLFFPDNSFGKSDDRLATEALTDYFDLIRSGNYESARGMWEPSAREKSTRFGIEYDGIQVKSDCNSPVIYDLEHVKDKLNVGIKSKSTLDTGLIRIQFGLETSKGTTTNLYYAKKLGDYFWFIFPQDYYAADWPVYESRYFRFFVNPQRDNSYNKIASATLDSFVEKTAAKLSISSDRLDVLAEKKIDYYLCIDPLEVRKLSGQQTDGFYDKASDAIISSVFPEFHLVAQLLVNFKLQKLPLFTLPVMEKGLAISFGGKWQRAPGVILDFGEYILDYKLTEIDSVLTAVGNENNDVPDITFPVEACLIDYIYNFLKADKFFQLYRSLSGDKRFISSLTTEDVKSIIADSFNQSWSEFKRQFENYISSDNSHGGRIFPGQTKTNQVLLNENGLVVSSSDKWLEISYSDLNDQNHEVTLMFFRPASLNGKSSKLFDEQIKNSREYNGYRYGIRIDANEIGLYDYAINQLRAKYVYNFAPDPAYFDSTEGKISAYFDIKLLDGNLPGSSDYEIIR